MSSKKKYELANELDGDQLRSEFRAKTVAEGGIIVNQDGSIGIAFKLQAPDTSCFSDAAKTDLFAKIRSLLNSMPSNFDVEWRHIPEFRTERLENIYAENDHRMPEGLTGEVIREQEKANVDALRGKQLRFLQLYLIIVRRSPMTLKQRRKRTMETLRRLRQEARGATKPSLLSRLLDAGEELRIQITDPGKLVQFEVAEYKEAVSELMRQARSVAETLESAGYEPQLCDSDAAVEILYSYWNRRRYDEGLRPVPVVPGKEMPLADRCILSPFAWDPTGKIIPRGVFFLDGNYHKIFSVITAPNEIGRGAWPHFENVLLNSDVGPPKMEMIVKCLQGDRAVRIKALRKEKDRTQNAIKTKGRPDDRDGRLLRDLEAELSSLEQSLERTWKSAIYFHLWDETPEGLADSANAMMKVANQLDIEICEEIWGLHRYFRATQPFWTQDPDRYRLFDYSSAQLVGMLPLCGQKTYLEKGQPLGAVYTTATGSLFNLFVHDHRRTVNAHVCICAGSRKGKSTLATDFLVAHRRYKLRATIVDLGGSFRRFTEVVGGNYIEFDVKKRTHCMNPLYIVDNKQPDEEELRARVFMLERMLCDARRDERFSQEDLPKVSEALRLTYSKHAEKEITLSDLRMQMKEMNLENWFLRLREWTQNGSKAAFCDGKNTINLSNPITTIDFIRVKDDPQLSAVLFQVATLLAGQLATLYPQDIKFLVYDEASSLLRNPVTAEAIDQEIRTLAKHGVGVVMLSQNFDDFTKNEVTRTTFMNNVPTWIFLGQDSEEVVRAIAQEKRLSPAETEKLAGLTTVFGRYSELMVVQNVNGRTETTHCFRGAHPLSYAMQTTASVDRAIFDGYEKQGLTVPEAIKRFAREHPQGADFTTNMKTEAA